MFRVLRLFGIFAPMLVLASCLLSCQMGGNGDSGEGGPPEGFKMPPTATVLEPVQLVDYAPAIELVGEVRASQRATLSAEVGGRVVSIAHRVGETHPRSAGALVQINSADYEAGVEIARAGLAQAEQALSMAETGPRPQEIAAQRAQVDASRAQYELALDNLNRQKELFDAGVIPESAIIAAQTQADAAEAAYHAQEEVLSALLEGTREEQKASAQAAVELSRSLLTQAELMLAKTAITPAFDAKVTALLVEVGSFVGPGTPVVEVISSGTTEAWFNLPETDIARIDPGDAVELRLDALPGEVLAGEVISVSAAADTKTRQFPVRVSITDERVLPGMVAYGRLLTEETKPVLAVPRDAVVLTNLGEVVYVMQPPPADAEPFMEGMPPLPVVDMQLVTTGETLGDLVVVEGNLTPGMMVVTRGNESLMAGSSIIPTNLMGEGGMGGAPQSGMEGAAPPEGMADGSPHGEGATPEPGASKGDETSESEAGTGEGQ
jgi:RND family efflux transporter MFP subunit